MSTGGAGIRGGGVHPVTSEAVFRHDILFISCRSSVSPRPPLVLVYIVLAFLLLQITCLLYASCLVKFIFEFPLFRSLFLCTSNRYFFCLDDFVPLSFLFRRLPSVIPPVETTSSGYLPLFRRLLSAISSVRTTYSG